MSKPRNVKSGSKPARVKQSSKVTMKRAEYEALAAEVRDARARAVALSTLFGAIIMDAGGRMEVTAEGLDAIRALGPKWEIVQGVDEVDDKRYVTVRGFDE